MKKIIIIVIALLIGSTAVFAQSKAGKQDLAKHTVLQSCPKHPGYIVYNPSKCPNCGMDLNLSAKEVLKIQVTKAYSCPVNMVSTRAGKLNLSPKEEMKMEIVKLNKASVQNCEMGMAMSNQP